jgi:diguanylate cyclase (GGDEF)-like protein/PAS domain S-box-containing protein
MQRILNFRHILLVGPTLVVVVTLATTSYLVRAKHADDISTGLEIAALHTRSLEDLVTQSLRVTELAATNALQRGSPMPVPGQLDQAFNASLRHAPFLRSISLLDDRGRIVASSNPANTGKQIPMDSFMPSLTVQRDGLGIGKPWTGRDFAAGSLAGQTGETNQDEPGLVPVIRRLTLGKRSATLLFALNPDYFVSHMTQNLGAGEGWAHLLRYDGTLLLGTDPAFQTGAVLQDVMLGLNLAEADSGQLEQDLGGSRRVLTAYRASGLYPFVVVTHIERDHALRHWRGTIKALLSFGLPALLALSLLTWVFYRRQTQLDAGRAESIRLQRISASVFDFSTEAILITDNRGVVVAINTAFTQVTACQPNDVVGQPLTAMLTPEAVEAFKTPEHPLAPIEVQLRCKDGQLLWNEILSTPAHDGQGRFTGYQHICRNINERKLAEDKLHLAASVFKHAREAILYTNEKNRIVDVNDAFCRTTGYSRSEVLGKNPAMLGSDRHDKSYYKAMWRTLREKGHLHGEFWNRHKNGKDYAVLMNISVVRDAQGTTRQYVALFSDITVIKEHQQQLEHIAHFDSLTGLPNRILLSDRLKQAMAQAQRRSQRLAVAFLDLDGFKAVNDTHGHEAGDHLLVSLGQRMKQALRDGDTLARLGGDEFVVVLSDLDSIEASAPILNRLLAAVARPVLLGDASLQVSGSLGLTFFPQSKEVDADQLLRQADQAMYQAKLSGKNRFHLFDAEQDATV